MSEDIKDLATFRGWRGIGLDFGYPQCCIDSFCNGRTYKEMSPHERQQHNGSVWTKVGFIPCGECMKKDARTVLKEIDKRRNKKHNTFLPNIIR